MSGGEFFADVRCDGKTIFEIQDFEIFEDGFMGHKEDLTGLLKYLIYLGIAKSNENLIHGN